MENNDLPKPITNLRLNSALKCCGKKSVREMYKKSIATYKWVYDPGECNPVEWVCSVDEEKKNISLKIVNNSNTEVVLIPLDKGVITGPKYTKGGVADCLLLSKTKFCLVEFKTNVNSQEREEDRIKKGCTQLLNTYNNVLKPCCKNMGILIEEQGLEITFHIVFNNQYHQLILASSRQLANQFDFTKTYRFPLIISRIKVF